MSTTPEGALEDYLNEADRQALNGALISGIERSNESLVWWTLNGANTESERTQRLADMIERAVESEVIEPAMLSVYIAKLLTMYDMRGEIEREIAQLLVRNESDIDKRKAGL